MAFLTVEDLVGTVEVIVFPRDYAYNKAKIISDAKVFISGRVSAGADEKAKLICEKMITFDEVPRTCWIRFQNILEYEQREQELFRLIQDSDGRDHVIIYCKDEKKRKTLPANRNIGINSVLLTSLKKAFGDENIAVT